MAGQGSIPLNSLKLKLHEIIFEADTPAGKAFDVILLWTILFSVVMVAIESVSGIGQSYRVFFYWGEWILTVLFTIEYLLRLALIRDKFRYAFSFYGLVDLLSILPTYIAFAYTDSHYFLLIRTLRLLRIFRIFKLVRFVSEARVLMQALRASRPRIIVFFGTVLTIVVIIGSLMYVIEGEKNGFTSIPRGIYWAIVTLTTVGYGDIAPKTALGQFIASMVMLLGYAIIAVPTGIVTAQMSKPELPMRISTQACLNCGAEGHDSDADFCKYCGKAMK